MNYELLGQKIKSVRIEKGLSQKKLAELTNVGLNTVSRIESNSNHWPRLKTMLKVTNYLKIDLGEF